MNIDIIKFRNQNDCNYDEMILNFLDEYKNLPSKEPVYKKGTNKILDREFGIIIINCFPVFKINDNSTVF